MELSQLADLGEFVGGVAVVVTLIYLAAQVRHNTRAVKAANNQAQADGHCSYLTAIFADPQLSETFGQLWNVADAGELGSAEAHRLSPLLHCAFTQFENAYRSHREGLITEAWWEKQAAALDGWLRAPPVQHWWDDQGEIYPSDFHGYIVGRLRQLANG